MNQSDEQAQIQFLADYWQRGFASVMETMADIRPEVERVDPPENSEKFLWWNQGFDLMPGAAVWIGTPEEVWVSLGQRVLAAAGIPNAGAEEQKSTYLEVVRQALAPVATQLGTRAGRQVNCVDGREEALTDQLPGCGILVKLEGNNLPAIAFLVTQPMLDALSTAAPDVSASAEEPAAGGEAENRGGALVSSRAHDTLDLLMDVELPVSVSFGRTQVRVQEILKLVTGSIIELERSISEPVELIVNNCVIARGEVVVVEGNYGVRIRQVMSRRERLQESRRHLLPDGVSR